MSVPVCHTINNWCPQITGSEPSGGWVCRLSVWGKHCGKYHICREKMQLSRAKPGNPASIYIGECVCVSVCVYPSKHIHVAVCGPIGTKFGTHMQIHLEKVVGKIKICPV